MSNSSQLSSNELSSNELSSNQLSYFTATLMLLTLSACSISSTTPNAADKNVSPLAIDSSSDPRSQPFIEESLPGYLLTWSDEFNGNSIDENRWRYRLDCKHWSQQKAENNSVSNGLYRIHLKKEVSNCPNNKKLQPGQKEGDTPEGIVQYSGGGIISTQLFRYGYYEARMKMPSGAGWHSSFWMMRQNPKPSHTSHKSHIELDPFENDSIDLQHYQTDAHQWKPKPGTADPGKTQNKVGTKQVRFTDNTRLDEFHVYGMEFTPSTLRYYFDGKLTSETAFDVNKYKHNDVSIWLTVLASYLSKTEAVDDAILPAETQVDYVRFYQKNQRKSTNNR